MTTKEYLQITKQYFISFVKAWLTPSYPDMEKLHNYVIEKLEIARTDFHYGEPGTDADWKDHVVKCYETIAHMLNPDPKRTAPVTLFTHMCKCSGIDYQRVLLQYVEQRLNEFEPVNDRYAVVEQTLLEADIAETLAGINGYFIDALGVYLPPALRGEANFLDVLKTFCISGIGVNSDLYDRSKNKSSRTDALRALERCAIFTQAATHVTSEHKLSAQPPKLSIDDIKAIAEAAFEPENKPAVADEVNRWALIVSDCIDAD